MTDDLLTRLSLRAPIFQAPMAGVSTPALAAAVAEAGGLGGLGLRASTPDEARSAILATRQATGGAFCANVFCHAAPKADPDREARWIARAAPLFRDLSADPPAALRDIYPSFVGDDAMLRVLLETRPPAVSFHFGLPRAGQLAALREAGMVLMASATSPAEARLIEAAGLDAIIAQGFEAGGHRGIFDPDGADDRMSTQDLTRHLAREGGLPVIAAGGLMDGADIAATLSWGAVAGQLGTAFIGCPESAAGPGYRARLPMGGTVMTSAISGRPARCLTNRLTAWGQGADAVDIPDYPRCYDLAKGLIAAARRAGASGIGAEWAGTGADRARAMPAGALVALLTAELRTAFRGQAV